ncbi:hypothetical protein N1851_015121 [Merluccius polli]|uniref:Uncharacterized protein n=1 Tax=Merluccius polli TaxID=89951 RepID=A0AA47MSR6_MERPO|nr:hypothetical protein N1851_015121 [Merluccius polli]
MVSAVLRECGRGPLVGQAVTVNDPTEPAICGTSPEVEVVVSRSDRDFNNGNKQIAGKRRRMPTEIIAQWQAYTSDLHPLTMERSQWSNLRRRAVKRTNDRIAKVEESLYTGVVWQMQGEMVSDIDLAENVETEIVMFHIASFTTTNEVEVVPAVWVNDNVCKWPPYKPDALHKAVRSHEQPKETWTPYPVKILYTSNDFEDARQRLSRAEIESDLQSEAEDDLRKRKPKPRQRFLPAELVIKKRPLPKLPAIPSLSSTLREAISPEPLPLHLSSEPSRFQQQCSPKSSRFQQQCSPESSRFQQQCSPESSRFQQQCSPESSRFQQQCSEPSRFQQQCSEPSRFQQQCSEPSRFQQQCSEPSRFQQQCSEPSRFQQQCSEPSRFQQQCSEPSRFQQQCSEPSRFQQQCSEPSRFQQQWPPEPSRFQQQWPPEPSRFQQQCSEPSRFQQQCSEPTQVDPMLRCEF